MTGRQVSTSLPTVKTRLHLYCENNLTTKQYFFIKEIELCFIYLLNTIFEELELR